MRVQILRPSNVRQLLLRCYTTGAGEAPTAHKGMTAARTKTFSVYRWVSTNMIVLKRG